MKALIALFAAAALNVAAGIAQARDLGHRDDYQRFGQPLSVHVAQDYTPVLQSFRHVRQMGLGLGVAALLLILLLQRLTVSRPLRPLEQVRQQIAQLQQGQRSELDSRVPASRSRWWRRSTTCWRTPKTP